MATVLLPKLFTYTHKHTRLTKNNHQTITTSLYNITYTIFASLILAVNYFESPVRKYIFASNVCIYMHKKNYRGMW